MFSTFSLLQAIASSVVAQCSEAGLTPENTLATVLAALTTATGVVGILIVGTGEAALEGEDGGSSGKHRMCCVGNRLPQARLPACLPHPL